MTTKIKTDATLPDISSADAKAAQKEGIKSAIAEDAARQFRTTDGAEVQDTEPGIVKTSDVFHLQDMLEMDPDDLKKALDGKLDGAPTPSEGQIAGLLEVERSGKNRDDVVQVLCKRLGVDTPYEVTDAGPAWTNVVNRKTVKPRG